MILLGNSEKLEPMRNKRKSPVTKYFHQIRSQAQSLHTALNRAWQCEDSTAHSAKLLLEKRVKSDKIGGPEIEDPSIIKFNVFFCHEPQKWASMSTLVSSPSDWCAAEIKTLDANQDLERQRSQSADLGSRPSLLETSSQHRSNISSRGSNASDTGGRRVAFVGSDAPSATLSVLDDAPEISDLCSILQKRMSHQSPIGYLKDPHEKRHSISPVKKPQPHFSQMQRVVSLDELIGRKDEDSGKAVLPRRRRLAIAVILANSMLQLHTGPWLCETWGKRDIHFLQGHDGFIHTKYLFLVCDFNSNNQTTGTDSEDERLERSTSRACHSSLLSLGILILELWFNQTIESQPFRGRF